MLDHMLKGRFVMGISPGGLMSDAEVFGNYQKDRNAIFLESINMVLDIWKMDSPYDLKGNFFNVSTGKTSIKEIGQGTILKPYQKPHPPMWVAVTSPGTEIDAAERGLGSLGLSFAGFEEQEKKIKEYRRRIQSCEPVGAFVNEQVATTNFLFCHEDEKYGVEMGKKLGNTFNYLATQLISTREVFSSPSYQSLGLLPALRRAATGPDANEQQTEGMAYGDPARIIRAVKKWESLGVDCINFILNANEVVPQAEVMASLKLFAKEVMPVFARKPADVAAAAGE